MILSLVVSFPYTPSLFIEACDKITHEYIRTHKHQRSPSPTLLGDTNKGNYSREGTQDVSDSEGEETQKEKFKLILRSSMTDNIPLTVRSTTTCGAIIKAFLRAAKLTEQYPGLDKSPNRGQTLKKGDKQPQLSMDGDKLDPASEIGDADLEDGDMIDVVGL